MNAETMTDEEWAQWLRLACEDELRYVVDKLHSGWRDAEAEISRREASEDDA